jgi:hypothetical protein
MSTTLMVAFGVATVALVAAPIVRPDPKKRALARARHQGDLVPLVEWVEAMSPARQANAWDQLLTELWRKYERELVARILMEAAPRCDARILQYWILQLMQTEPEIAQEVFTPEFLYEHFKPEVAASCGRCGCGG